MGKHIVILGGGTAGTMTANRLCPTYDDGEYRITVVDLNDDHVYQPGLLFVPFGRPQPHHLVRPGRGNCTQRSTTSRRGSSGSTWGHGRCTSPMASG